MKTTFESKFSGKINKFNQIFIDLKSIIRVKPIMIQKLLILNLWLYSSQSIEFEEHYSAKGCK